MFSVSHTQCSVSVTLQQWNLCNLGKSFHFIQDFADTVLLFKVISIIFSKPCNVICVLSGYTFVYFTIQLHHNQILLVPHQHRPSVFMSADCCLSCCLAVVHNLRANQQCTDVCTSVASACIRVCLNIYFQAKELGSVFLFGVRWGDTTSVYCVLCVCVCV